MSDKHPFSWSPVIVGAVIGLIGILTGFYVADNAQQQLQAMSQQPPSSDQDAPSAETPLPAQPLQELPPLDPVVQEPLPAMEEDIVDSMAAEVAEEEVSPQTAPVEEPTPIATVADEAEEDDFEEMTVEEIEAASVKEQPVDSLAGH